ncbi:hypothetical protein [Mycolicibacterium gilvum]|uniref:DUF3298 domain-containing protein n=1 Tax=Mycolicibacterium gilvum (strain DSM 45189 / LMG 24558 / Spyr1) TaxID=278137 RepID=E6TGB1_MYCSR|nr:hypothetical protein [Mycolicibacterium gilvum]ADU00026.1 hypothetical protein Mspyr1_34140 [Mycolicibacterium gilvum Spyr1]
MTRRAAIAAIAACLLSGCGHDTTGTATWPGARLEKAVLTEADFPSGVVFERITRDRADGDDAAGPPPMLSEPEGCTDGLTRDIAGDAERGPGSAVEYVVVYDGARMVITVLSWRLDLDRLAATAQRCAEYRTFFDESDPGVAMTTTPVPVSRADALAYEQTMYLPGQETSVYFAFENVGAMAVFGIAFPTPDPSIPVKGALPQTFLDITAKQAERARTV